MATSAIKNTFSIASATYTKNTSAIDSASSVEIDKVSGICSVSGYIRGKNSSVAGGTNLLTGVDTATFRPRTSNSIYFTAQNASGNTILLKIPSGTANVQLQNTATLSGDYYVNYVFIALNP